MIRTLAAIGLVFALVTSASAEPPHKWGHHQRDRDASASFWGGVLGGWVAQAFRPDREGADVEGDLEPWTKSWYVYCSDKYRSFNPRTGRYFGYDGEWHFCE